MTHDKPPVLKNPHRLLKLLGVLLGVFALLYVGVAATAFTGAASTVMFGAFDGGPVLLLARLMWGLSFAALTLICLAYAVDDRKQAGARAGLSRAIQQAGPALSLTAGGWLAGAAGPPRRPGAP